MSLCLWQTGQTPLMLAASRNRLDMLDLLLDAGVQINAVDDVSSFSGTKLLSLSLLMAKY